MKIFISNILMLGFILVTATGCATYWQMKKVDEDVTSLKNQLKDLRTKSVLLQKEVYDLKNNTGKIDENSLQTKADLSTQIESLESQIVSLNYKIDEVNERLSLFFQKFDSPVVKDAQEDSSSASVTSKNSFEERSGSNSNHNINASELYKNAKLDFSNGYYSLSIQGFTEYIKFFPQSDLADDAQFYIGEIYYAQGDYQQAINAFEKVNTEYLKSNRLPSAFLKIGYSYFELNDVKSGRAYLNKLIRDYPSADETSLARSKLNQH